MCLTVDSEFHYIVTVNGKQCELDWLELPNSISNIQDFLLILQSLDELNFCNGISVTKFEDVLCDDFKNGIYMKYDKYLGPVHDNVLKSFNCLEAISSMSQSNCLHCFELKSYLYHLMSRIKLFYLYHLMSRIKLQKSNPDSCHTSFKFKTEEQLNQDFAILKKKFQEKEKEYRKNKFEESDLLSKSDDDDLRQILSCLNSGFSEMNKKIR
jgi:hypothetical protein